MNKHLISLGMAILLICLGLSGCTQEDDAEKFIGTWQLREGFPGGSYTFFSNGTCNFENEGGTWEIEDGVIITNISNGLVVYNWNYEFSDNYTQLTLIPVEGGSTLVYYKQ